MTRTSSWKEEDVGVRSPVFSSGDRENLQGKILIIFLESRTLCCELRSEILIYSSRENSAQDSWRKLANIQVRSWRSKPNSKNWGQRKFSNESRVKPAQWTTTIESDPHVTPTTRLFLGAWRCMSRREDAWRHVRAREFLFSSVQLLFTPCPDFNSNDVFMWIGT